MLGGDEDDVVNDHDHVPISITPASVEQTKQTNRHTVDDQAPPANPYKHTSDGMTSVISSKSPANLNKHGHGRAKKRRVANNDSFKAASKNPTKNRVVVGGRIMDILSILAWNKAIKLQANLSTKYPSFVKSMTRSHVTQGYWLGLSQSFCDEHLPIRNTDVILVDEDGNSSITKYLAAKSALSGGWKGFAIEHDLQEGDAVVFHLIDTAKFKVYIVRKAESGEAREQGSENYAQSAFKAEDKVPPLNSLSPVSSNVDLEAGVLDGIRLSDSVIEVEALKGFDNFNIIYDGLILEFSDIIKENYYQLCCCHKSILHGRLLKGLHISLVVGIISETINIADAIRASNASISHKDLQDWDRTLKCFEVLGMDVAFLRAQLDLLLGSGSEALLKVKMDKVVSEIEAEIAASARRGQD